MKNMHPFYLQKNEDLAAYKRFAETGMDLMFPVSIKGRTHRPDINIPYHNTIKLFDTSKDKAEHVHAIASQLPLNPPDPRQVNIEPTTLKGRQGNIMHVIKLHGPHADTIKEHHNKFSHLGYKENYQYAPHVTVDEATWKNIVQSKAKTAHEAGIEFHPAELHHKEKVVSNYTPKENHQHKLAASEDLRKSMFTNLGVAAAMSAGLLSNASQAPTKANPNYSTQHMLRAIASVESSGGKNTAHGAGGGAIHGNEHAYGKYGLMPQTIRETVAMNHDLKSKYRKATMLHGNDLHRYMQDNPGLEDTIAEKHLKRLEHHFGTNPSDLGFAWLQGIKGTYAAKKNNEDTGNHWHAKKVTEAYQKEK